MKNLSLLSLIAIMLLVGAGCSKNASKPVEPTGTQNTTEAVEDGISGEIPDGVADFPLQLDTEADATYKLNTEKSVMRWHGSYLSGRDHYGTVMIKSGEVKIKDKKMTEGMFVFDLTTIKDEKGNERLETHLKSDDFFSVEKFPTAEFKLTKVEPTGATGSGEFTVTGLLKIKEIEKEITFPAKLFKSGSDTEIKGEAKFSLDRTEWNVRYGSGKFFKNLGDKIMDDKMDFELKLVAEKAQ